MKRSIGIAMVVVVSHGVALADAGPATAPGAPALAGPVPSPERPDAGVSSSFLASPRPSSLALPRGKLMVTLTFEIEASADKLGEPVTVAPDVTYGATDRLSLSVVHSKFAVTGFRAVAGGGVCLGDDATCAHVYNNVGGEALYALTTGPFAIAAVGGVHALDLDQGFYDAKLGGRLRAARGKLGVTVSPSVLVAMTERTDAMGAARNKDFYYVPVLGTYKVMPPLTVGLGTGIKGAFQDAGKAWEFPIGLVATYAIERRVTLGGSLVFGKVFGGADATGMDFRGTQLWVVVVP